MTGYIYTLTDNKTNNVFYVGSTIDLKTRYLGHKNNGLSSTSAHIKENVEFSIEEVDSINFTDRKELLSLERYWIEQFRQWGFDLLNIQGHNKIMMKKSFTVQLKDIPEEVDSIIRNEQLRIELYEKNKLKKEHVVYRIIREWHSKFNKLAKA